MSTNTPQCPKCKSEYVYADQMLWICPECAHEWDQATTVTSTDEPQMDDKIRDANGQILMDGDNVTVIKNLPVKGSAQGIKIGTKVKNIKLLESTDGHNLACKIDGIGQLHLKSEFVRKS